MNVIIWMGGKKEGLVGWKEQPGRRQKFVLDCQLMICNSIIFMNNICQIIFVNNIYELSTIDFNSKKQVKLIIYGGSIHSFQQQWQQAFGKQYDLPRWSPHNSAGQLYLATHHMWNSMMRPIVSILSWIFLSLSRRWGIEFSIDFQPKVARG